VKKPQKSARKKTPGHPKGREIAAFVSGALLSAKRAAITLHLAGCTICRKIAGEVEKSRKAVPDPPSFARRKRKNGR
jgi:hypothetical protein